MMQFNKNLALFSVLVGAVLSALVYAANLFAHINWVWMGFAFFVVLSWSSYSYIMSAIKLDHNRFISRFLFLTTARIILTAIFLAIYLIISAERDPAFIVVFMALYLFYTLFEIYHLVTKLRAEKYESVEDTNS